MNLRPLDKELNQVLLEEDRSGTKSSLEESDQKVLQEHFQSVLRTFKL